MKHRLLGDRALLTSAKKRIKAQEQRWLSGEPVYVLMSDASVEAFVLVLADLRAMDKCVSVEVESRAEGRHYLVVRRSKVFLPWRPRAEAEKKEEDAPTPHASKKR